MRTSPWMAIHIAGLIAVILGLIAVTGTYVRQMKPAGSFGLISFIIAFTGMVLIVGLAMYEALIVPTLAEEAPELLEPDGPLLRGASGLAFVLSTMIFLIGFVLYETATIRAGV